MIAPFEDEGDLRKWVKWNLNDRVVWIEQRSGGTVGMTDCLFMLGGRLVPVELKCWEMVGESRLKVELRPSQRALLRKLLNYRVPAWVLAAQHDGYLVGLVPAARALHEETVEPWWVGPDNLLTLLEL